MASFDDDRIPPPTPGRRSSKPGGRRSRGGRTRDPAEAAPASPEERFPPDTGHRRRGSDYEFGGRGLSYDMGPGRAGPRRPGDEGTVHGADYPRVLRGYPGSRYDEDRILRMPGAGHRWPDDDEASASLSDRLTDAEIREAVRERLLQDTWIDPDEIDVRVEAGVVTLTGAVDDFLQARYAWDDAWESRGVYGVINNLTVRLDPRHTREDDPNRR